jgi:gamma-glutamylcyclotransferase (GGCT)/AIG2-like uncharacterized protein YtfP
VPPDSPLRLFAYGTLRAAALDASTSPLLEGAALVGEGTVRGALGRVGPYLALEPGEDEIAGDVWQIDDAMLAALDAYEGDGYERTEIDVRVRGETLRAWVYVKR